MLQSHVPPWSGPVSTELFEGDIIIVESLENLLNYSPTQVKPYLTEFAEAENLYLITSVEQTGDMTLFL